MRRTDGHVSTERNERMPMLKEKKWLQWKDKDNHPGKERKDSLSKGKERMAMVKRKGRIPVPMSKKKGRTTWIEKKG